MISKEWLNRNGLLAATSLFIVLLAVFFGSFVFTKPDHLQGTVIEKIHVPSKFRRSDTPYLGIKRGAYSVRVTTEDQWIAVVVTDQGDTLAVHCDPDHYGVKEVGDRIKFREYQGSLVHIEFFAHGEQEGD